MVGQINIPLVQRPLVFHGFNSTGTLELHTSQLRPDFVHTCTPLGWRLIVLFLASPSAFHWRSISSPRNGFISTGVDSMQDIVIFLHSHGTDDDGAEKKMENGK